MKSLLLRFIFVVLLPALISGLSVIFAFVGGYSELKATVASHIAADDKQDNLLERRLQVMDGKLDILLLNRAQLNERLERIINDNGGKKIR